MGFNDERYFYLGGMIAFGLFSFILFVIGYTVILSPKIEQFALTQSQYISVSMEIPSSQPAERLQQPEQTAAAEPTPKSESPSQEEPAASVPEISDLFSKVKPQITPKKKDDSAEKIEALSAIERSMSARSQTTPQLADKVKNTALAKPSVKVVSNSGSTGPLVNEYHAKIQALIYANYYPPSGSQGQSARVRIYLNALGSLSGYRVMAYSGNTPFNSEVDWLKERLRTVVFPIHPDGKDTVIEIILTAKE